MEGPYVGSSRGSTWLIDFPPNFQSLLSYYNVCDTSQTFVQTLEDLIHTFSKRQVQFLAGGAITLIRNLLEMSITIYAEGYTPILAPNKVIVPKNYVPVLNYTRLKCTEESIVEALFDLIKRIGCCTREKDLAILTSLCRQGTKMTLKKMSSLLASYCASHDSSNESDEDLRLLTAAELGLTKSDDIRSFMRSFSKIPFTTEVIIDNYTKNNPDIRSKPEEKASNNDSMIGLTDSGSVAADPPDTDLINSMVVREPATKKLSLSTMEYLPMADSKKYQKPLAMGEQTPLMAAVHAMDSDAIDKHIAFLGHAMGRSLNLKVKGETITFASGTTALMIAARIGFLDGVQKLIREVRIRNSREETAIMMAAIGNHVSCIEELIPFEARTRDSSGVTALMKAAQLNNLSAVKALCPHESKMVSRRHSSALHMATDKNFIDVVRILANYEAGAVNSRGETSLLLAITKGYLEIALFLAPLEGHILDAEKKSAIQRIQKLRQKHADLDLWEECISALKLTEKKRQRKTTKDRNVEIITPASIST